MTNLTSEKDKCYGSKTQATTNTSIVIYGHGYQLSKYLSLVLTNFGTL